MSRKKSGANKGKKQSKNNKIRKMQNKRQQREDLIQDTTAVITCLTEATGDFLGQCQDRLEALLFDLPIAKLARQIWNGQPGKAEQFTPIIDDLVAEYERSNQVLEAIESRLAALAQSLLSDEQHHHLNPPEDYRDLVRKCLFPDQDEQV